LNFKEILSRRIIKITKIAQKRIQLKLDDKVNGVNGTVRKYFKKGYRC